MQQCCCETATCVTHLVYIFLNFIIQHAMHMRQIFICVLFGSTIFPHYLIKGKIFVKTLLKIMCLDFLYKFCLKHSNKS